MKKSGVGVGSASIILVFAVLCLAVFSLITRVVTKNDYALIGAEAELVAAYYEADAVAGRILAEILKADVIPDAIFGVDIEIEKDSEQGMATVGYTCEISDSKALFVKLAVGEGSYEIVNWKMQDTDEWVLDDTINVWDGE